ncbi:MAG: hypothetical protein ABS951_03655 [Solibacillus sp.]
MLNNKLNKNAMIAINLLASLIALVAGIGLNFILAPIIVENLGVEANGFVQLANNFVMFANLITIALNSMAGRFISIAYQRGEFGKAQGYYSTISFANWIITIIILIPFSIITYYLDTILEVPKDILSDVQLLFGFIFINFLILTLLSTWGVATFITNKLYLQSLNTICSQLIRLLLTFGLFVLYEPTLHFIGLAILISTIYVCLMNYIYKIKLTPDLKYKKSKLSFNKFKEVTSSGIWNTIQTAGFLMLTAVDLLVVNLLLGPHAMGVLSIAKLLPTTMLTISGTINSIFIPNFLNLYASNKISELGKEVKQSMKIVGILLMVPLTCIFIFGQDFYRLWVPTEDASLLYYLTSVSILNMIFTSSISPMFNLFTITNKLKFNAILIIVSGFLNIILMILLIKYTDLGIYAVAGLSTIINLIRNLCFIAPYSAKCIGLKWYAFYPKIISFIIPFGVVMILGYLLKNIYHVYNWFDFFIVTVLMSLITFIVNYFIALTKHEKKLFLNFFWGKIIRR